jgi:hypothetical protein
MTHPRPRCKQGGGGCWSTIGISETYAIAFNHVTDELPARPGFGFSLPEKRFRPWIAGSFHYTCFPGDSTSEDGRLLALQGQVMTILRPPDTCHGSV